MKIMDKIEIQPVDVDVRIRATGVKIWNEFKNLGFVRRQAFKNIVQEILPEYAEKENELNLFWVGRYYNQHFNDDLQNVLEQLKSE